VRLLVAQFPLRFGKPGVSEVLKGMTARRQHAERTELFGSLAHLSKAAIARTVDDLVARGELVVEQRDGYSMLRLAQTQEDGAY
jgi:RQC domain-containing protein